MEDFTKDHGEEVCSKGEGFSNIQKEMYLRLILLEEWPSWGIR